MRLLFTFEIDTEEEMEGQGEKGLVWKYYRTVLHVAEFNARHEAGPGGSRIVNVAAVIELAGDFVGRMSMPVRGTNIRLSVSAPDPQVDAAMKSFMEQHGPWSKNKRYRFRAVGPPTFVPNEFSRDFNK